MKYSLLIFILSVGFLACGGGDSACNPETVEGTYTGTNECPENIVLGIGDLGNVTIEVRNTGDNNYVAQYPSGVTNSFTLDGCDISIPKDEAMTQGGVKIETSGEGTINGDNFTLSILTVVDGIEYTCFTSVTKN